MFGRAFACANCNSSCLRGLLFIAAAALKAGPLKRFDPPTWLAHHRHHHHPVCPEIREFLACLYPSWPTRGVRFSCLWPPFSRVVARHKRAAANAQQATISRLPTTGKADKQQQQPIRVAVIAQCTPTGSMGPVRFVCVPSRAELS